MEFGFYIVIGPVFSENFIKKLLYLNHHHRNIKLCFNANMSYIMKKYDLAIAACGSTLYELAACNIPTIGVVLAENQVELANSMEEQGMIYNIGWYNKLNKK